MPKPKTQKINPFPGKAAHISPTKICESPKYFMVPKVYFEAFTKASP